MTKLQSEVRVLEWHEPDGSRVRGSLIVLAGRGETPEVYARFGKRISADAYRVIAYSDAFGNEDFIIDDVRSRIASGGLVSPVVLVGSDVGAVAAVDVAREFATEVSAVVLAAYPSPGSAAIADDWETELLERTSCPVHRGVLDADGGVAHGTLAAALDPARIQRDLGELSQPVLVVHGGADLVSPLAQVLPVYEADDDAQIFVIEGAKHDVLNDATHRTTAAVIVQFLETLKSGLGSPIARRVR